MVYRQKGLIASESFVRAFIALQRLPIFQANHCHDMGFTTNLYWTLVAFGFLKDEAIAKGDFSRHRFIQLFGDIHHAKNH